MSIDIGKLDRRITIEQRTLAYDAMNHPSITWSTRDEVWARMNERKGRDRDEDEQRVMSYPVEFTIRHRSDVESTDRISYGGKLYQITSIQEIDRKAGLTIMATAKDNE